MSHTKIAIDQLVLGRTLPCAIHDTGGTLLLAIGEVLTPEHKRRLLSRGVHQVVIDDSHLGQVALLGDDPKAIAECERKLEKLVEGALRAGRFDVQNHGPAVAERVVDHGCKRYDPEHQNAVQDQLSMSSGVIRTILEGPFHSLAAASGKVTQIASSTTGLLAQDFAATLHTTLRHRGESVAAQHALKVATLSMAIAIDMKLDAENVKTVGISGLLADVGMTQIPKDIREARRRLTRNEFAKIQRHVIYTANLIEQFSGISDLVRIVTYQCHERPDGSGYLRGRNLETIHPFALILAVADTYAAMTTTRSFRPPMMPYAAVREILLLAKRRKVDATATRSLLHVLSLFPIGSYCALSDGSVAQVMRANAHDYAHPIVARIQDASGTRLDPEDESVLIELSSSDLKVVQALPRPGSDEVNLEGPDAEAASAYCLWQDQQSGSPCEI